MFVQRYAIKKNFTVNSSLYLVQCGYEDCIPNHSYGPAIRDHNLIHFILSGSGTLEIYEKTITVSAGQGFLIPTGVPTKYTADNDTPWEYCWFGFNGEDSDAVMSHRGLSSLNNLFTFREYDKIKDCVFDMLATYGEGGNDFLTMSKLYEIFSYINPHYQPVEHQSSTVNSIFEYIENHFAEDISIGSLAKQFNLSRTQLFRYFKETVNMPPQQYIKRYRINYAANLLRFTNMTVNEVKTASGFNDLCNFSRQFSMVYSRSPSAFRKFANSHTDSFITGAHSPGGKLNDPNNI